MHCHSAQPRQLREPGLPAPPEPQAGPFLARFRGCGGLSQGQLVVGPWRDLSPHFHVLLKVFAEKRVAAKGRVSGVEKGPDQVFVRRGLAREGEPMWLRTVSLNHNFSTM